MAPGVPAQFWTRPLFDLSGLPNGRMEQQIEALAGDQLVSRKIPKATTT